MPGWWSGSALEHQHQDDGSGSAREQKHQDDGSDRAADAVAPPSNVPVQSLLPPLPVGLCSPCKAPEPGEPLRSGTRCRLEPALSSVSPCCSQLSCEMRTGVYFQAQASSGAAPAHPLPRLPLTAKTPKAFVQQADVLGSDQLLLPGSALK